MSKKNIVSIFILLFFLSTAVLFISRNLSFVTRAENTDKKEVIIIIKNNKIAAEIAYLPAERSIGLMFRDHLPPNKGMLFIFPEQQHVSFWMKNTYFPIDIAFIRQDRKIVKTATLKPLDENPCNSDYPVKYVLETNAGYFKNNKIGLGEEILFPEILKKFERLAR